jgi:hypothetical protein
MFLFFLLLHELLALLNFGSSFIILFGMFGRMWLLKFSPSKNIQKK